MLCSQPHTYSTSVLKFNKFGFERSLWKKSLRCKAKPYHACQPGTYTQHYLKLNPDTYTLSAIKLTKKLLRLKLLEVYPSPPTGCWQNYKSYLHNCSLLSCSSSQHVAPNLSILEMLNYIHRESTRSSETQITVDSYYQLPQDMEIYSIHKAGLKKCCVYRDILSHASSSFETPSWSPFLKKSSDLYWTDREYER